MISVYVNLIKKGLKSIDEVPEKIKEEVQAILSADVAD
ncbi:MULTISPECIES: CD1375 family protein [Enterococcus]|nr:MULTISPECIES: CD1375 family protein [Enterococcus]OTO15095.1 hypothetical protein A5875_004252 [Enterococcus sp. 3H8_DIV0648]